MRGSQLRAHAVELLRQRAEVVAAESSRAASASSRAAVASSRALASCSCRSRTVRSFWSSARRSAVASEAASARAASASTSLRSEAESRMRRPGVVSFVAGAAGSRLVGRLAGRPALARGLAVRRALGRRGAHRAARRGGPRRRRAVRLRQLEGQVGADGQLGGDGAVIALPGEGGDPLLAVQRGPRLVLHQSEQAARLAVELHFQGRPDEAPSAQAEPAAFQLKPVVRGPLEPLDLERHAHYMLVAARDAKQTPVAGLRRFRARQVVRERCLSRRRPRPARASAGPRRGAGALRPRASRRRPSPRSRARRRCR